MVKHGLITGILCLLGPRAVEFLIENEDFANDNAGGG